MLSLLPDVEDDACPLPAKPDGSGVGIETIAITVAVPRAMVVGAQHSKRDVEAIRETEGC